jgi:hypothetical protein
MVEARLLSVVIGAR